VGARTIAGAATTAALAAAIAVSAAAAYQPRKPDISLEERWRTKGTAGILEFGSVEGMVETAGGAIWISDPLGKVVASTDARGRSLRVVAREGDGPGEVRSPTLAAPVPTGGMAIYDQEHDAVELFRDDGRFIRRVPLSAKVLNPKGFAVLANGEMLLSGGLLSGGGGAVHRFGADGRLLSSWGATARARDPRVVGLVSGGPLAALPGGEVLYSQAAPHLIASYSATGQRRRLIASDPVVVRPMGDEFIQRRGGQRVFQWRFPQSAGVFRLTGGNVLNVVWNAPANASTWEVYRPTGGLVVRKRIARAYRPWALARNGDVLATVVDAETGEVVVVRLALRIG
jgi:phage-related protein